MSVRSDVVVEELLHQMADADACCGDQGILDRGRGPIAAANRVVEIDQGSGAEVAKQA